MKRLIGWIMLIAALAVLLVGLPYAVGGWQCVMFVWGAFLVAALLAAWSAKAIDLIEG